MAKRILARYIFVIVIVQEMTLLQGWLPKFPFAPTPAPSTTVKQYVQTGKYPNWNFTDGLGSWRNKENLLWEVVTSQKKDAGTLTGRQGTGDGFATIENARYFKGKVAKLYSNFITGPVCMKFYFYLYGGKTGQIKVFTKRKNSNSENVMFKRYGNHGHKWNFAQLFLDFLPLDIYQVVIYGGIHSLGVQAGLAIDDISFTNESCELIPKDKNFNCSFDTGPCGWKLKGSTRVKYDTKLNQYIGGLEHEQQGSLRSPEIIASKACFTFQYMSSKGWSLDNSRMFVYVKDVESEELLPVSDKLLYYGHSKWNTIKIDLNVEHGFTQVVIDFYLVTFDISFANFVLNTEIKSCGSVVEKSFFVSARKTFPKEYEISEDGRSCDSYPSSYFMAQILPSPEYPVPFWIYLDSHHMTLSRIKDSTLGNLVGYFYVSTTWHTNSSAIYYTTDKDKYGEYISEFRSSPPERNWTGNVVYVRSHEIYKDNRHCPPGYFRIAKKCFWFICEKDTVSGAEARCSKDFGSLASLHSNNIHRVGEYLNRIQVRSIEITHISIGLSRKDQKWIWADGRVYNDSKGILGYQNNIALLTWNETGKQWELMGADSAFLSLHLCERARQNFAYYSWSEQSTTELQLASELAVDGFLYTCTLTQLPLKRSQYSWWRLKLTVETKVYMMQVIPSPRKANDLKALISVGLREDNRFPDCKKEIYIGNLLIPIICEPPLPSRYVKIETRDERVELCEVEIYGDVAESYAKIQGVLNTFWGKYLDITKVFSKLTREKNYPNNPLFFNLGSSFVHINRYFNRIRETSAFFLASNLSNYTFTLFGNVEAELKVTTSRYSANNIMTLLLEKQKSSYSMKSESASVILEACHFYFVKLVTTYSEYTDKLSLGIKQEGGQYQTPIDSKTLFWALPGQLDVKFHLANDTPAKIPMSYPVNITGIYNSECLGLYCGDCPLAIFLIFADYIKCVETTNLSIAQKGAVSLYLVNWFMLPGQKPVYMGYKINGDCRTITKTIDSNFTFSNSASKIGDVLLQPMILTSCQFKHSKLCEGNGMAYIHGWRKETYIADNNGKRYVLSATVNMTSVLNYEWIEYTNIVQKTGICLRFEYKTNGDNNTLAMYFKTSSGNMTLVWMLRGNHGNKWNYGAISYYPDEALSFIFEGQTNEEKSTISLANVMVTTESCSKDVYPLYAGPEYKCGSNVFVCANGECINRGLVCDGDKNCADGSDEVFCKCLAEQFKCEKSEECIDVRQICNGLKDCADGSDENDCYKTCKPDQFYCPSGICISWNLTCNGVWNCPDGADEPLVCGNGQMGNKMCSLNDLGCSKYSKNKTFCPEFVDGNCDFEKDRLCNWQQIQNGEDNFDWSINSGETFSKGTGPEVDHTTGSKKGSYIYIEASSPRIQGDKAILKAGPFKNNVNMCFTFQYHMFGSNIGSLSVYQAWNETDKLVLWTRKTPTNNAWKTAWFEVRSEQQFFLLIEGVCGDGALGDIAVDDISIVHKNCSQVHNVTSPFCSFEEDCIWKWTEGVWEVIPLGDRNNFMLQDYFLKTKTSGELWATLSEEMTEQFQCMTFWYTFYYCNGMSFYSTQELGSNRLEMNHSLSDVQKNIQWLFGEMPLKKRNTKSKVTFRVHIQSQSPYAETPDKQLSKCYLGIDEINFSIEPCLSFQQGGSIWMRKFSKFYKVLKKQNKDGSITAFYNSSFNPKDPDSLQHLDSSRSKSQSFINKISPNLVNYIVEDVKSLEYSEIFVGERVFVEESVNTAVLGTVILKTVNKFEHKLTVRLDLDASDIVLENENIYALPYQLDRHGPTWLTKNQNCYSYINGSCYFFLRKKMNWFEGVDSCKTYGGEIGKFNSEYEEQFHKTMFASLPFWIGYHGHKYHGTKFVWSDGSADVYNKLDKKSEKEGLTAGLCTLVTKSPLWKKANCSESHFVLCRKPDKEEKIITSCGEKTLACPISTTVIHVHRAELGALRQGMCSTSVIANETCARLYIFSKSQVLAEIKAMCEGRNKCNISVNSLSSDPCPFERKYMNILYRCMVRSRNYPVLAATNSVFRLKGWKKFGSSYYKLYTPKTTWQDAKATCKLQEGATLVSFNNKQEEDYVTKQMKSNGVNTFHIGLKATYYPGTFEWLDGSIISYRNWASGFPKSFTGKPTFASVGLNGWFASDANITAAFVCKYTPGIGPCDFETSWCGWQNNFTANGSRWYRSVREDCNQCKSSEESQWGVYRGTQASEHNVYTYTLKNTFKNDIYLRADRPKKIKQLTLCVWVYIDKRSSSSATVIVFGTKLQVKIYLREDHKFGVSFFVWNSTTNASVSFDSWQHLCFTIDTQTNLWNFYKNGLWTDVALLSLPTFSPDVFDTEDNKVFLGRNPKETTCSFGRCTNPEQLQGKITKPNMWSKIVDAHEISILASGCGIFSDSGDIEVSQDVHVTLEKRLIDHGECTGGKGFRLISRNEKNTSSVSSISTLISSWMRSSLDRVRGACMDFTYRLLGQNSQMSIWIEPRNIKKERLWSVKSSRKYNLWKIGRVFLGVVSEFRVHITATLWSNTSEVNLDNIFFTEGHCASDPKNAQEWHTDIVNRSSGYLTSPYYPSFYLNNMNRSWKIEVPADRRIKLVILFQNLEYDRQCGKDSVTVKHAFSSRKFLSYCGTTLPTSYLSTDNTVYVAFQSDEFNVGTGFKIHFQSVAAENTKDSCQENDIPDCLSTLRCSAISSNKSNIFVDAQDLMTMPEYFPAGTTAINFDGNFVVRLAATDFANLMQLEYLSISNNKIIDIYTKAFSYLTSLQILRLSKNFIDRLPKTVFHKVNSLEVLDLSMNRLHNLDKDLFVGLKRLRLLSLRKNFITSLEDPVFASLDNLQYLYLDENDLSTLESNVFNANVMLKALILKNNKLETVKASWLRRKHFLQVLNLQHNNIKEIETGAFDDLKNLVELDISNNKIQIIPENLFQYLVSLRNLKVDHFTLCCYAKQKNPGVSCFSKVQDGFSSCDELLKNVVLKYSIWILGIMAFFGNIIVIAWRSFSKDKNRVSSFLLTNLAVADFLMGVYMLLIAYKDRVWDGIYFKHDISWRASNLCIFAGVISTVSSEVSVLTLTVITLERMICIVFPFKFRRWSMKKSSAIMIFVWLLGICISLVPLTNDAYFYDYENNVHFFGRSAVCLPFQLSSDCPAGWEYSVFVFLVLNGVSFLFMLVAYVLMYRTVVKAASAVRSTRVNQDSAIAKRMMFIILTDFLCWFPVIIISILALTGNLYDPSKQVYAWIAVFVLPINSSINPLLYTFSTPYVRNRIPTANPFSKLSTNVRRKNILQKVWRKHILAEQSSTSSRDTIQTGTSPLPSFRSNCGTKFVNEGYRAEDNIAESSFTKSLVSEMDYFIKLMEDTQSFVDADKAIKSYIAVETDHKETLYLVHIYKSKQEELWLKTINILTWLYSDGGHENILPHLWSAKAVKVHVEREESFKSIMLDLEPNDCLICYQLPSKQTLASYLEKKNQEVTREMICFILTDIMGAVSYLSSKKVIHKAIVPENIFLTTSNKTIVEKALLGGFHALGFLNMPTPEDEQQSLDFNVTSFGRFLQILLDACPAMEISDELSDIMASCLDENCANRPTTSKLLKRLDALMLRNLSSNDAIH